MIQDTVKKGDTFGTIIEKQNIGSRKSEIVTKCKRHFDVRVIKPNRHTLYCDRKQISFK
jgi:hypothetical protein